jgi:phosphoribosylglycinamide formyltransferase 1
MIRLALLASGTGTNAENIIRYFTGHALLTVGLVVSNHPDAKVLQKAARHKVPGVVFERQAWKTPAEILECPAICPNRLPDSCRISIENP